MPRLKPILLAAVAVLCASLAVAIALRVGSGAWPVIALFGLIALTCTLHVITLAKWPPPNRRKHRQ